MKMEPEKLAEPGAGLPRVEEWLARYVIFPSFV